MVLEVPPGVPVFLGQRHPQLDAVQGRGAWGGDLGVADAVAARHEVELAGPYVGVAAEAVAVLDLPAEQPAHRLQSGMRMRCDIHPARAADIVGAVVVGETPGTDEGPGSLRERTSHGHRPRPSERDIARGEYVDPWTRGRPFACHPGSATPSGLISFRVTHRGHLLQP